MKKYKLKYNDINVNDDVGDVGGVGDVGDVDDVGDVGDVGGIGDVGDVGGVGDVGADGDGDFGGVGDVGADDGDGDDGDDGDVGRDNKIRRNILSSDSGLIYDCYLCQLHSKKSLGINTFLKGQHHHDQPGHGIRVLVLD